MDVSLGVFWSAISNMQSYGGYGAPPSSGNPLTSGNSPGPRVQVFDMPWTSMALGGGAQETPDGIAQPGDPQGINASHAPSYSGPGAPARTTYSPTWSWVAPPGIGDAPQQVWKTYWLAPYSMKGPGDNPMDMRRSLQPAPVASGFTATLFGQPVDGGQYLFRALSLQNPITPPPGLGLAT
jgi:hypothetical protein